MVLHSLFFYYDCASESFPSGIHLGLLDDADDNYNDDDDDAALEHITFPLTVNDITPIAWIDESDTRVLPEIRVVALWQSRFEIRRDGSGSELISVAIAVYSILVLNFMR